MSDPDPSPTARRLALALLLGSLALGCARTARAPTTADAVLPLRTVRLYETGVGYFERAGTLAAGGGVALPVPSSHIDDALKSLVVLDGGAGATVGGLEFSASVTAGMARALAGLPKDADQTLSFLDLLSSLEGEEVDVVAGEQTIVGRVIDVAAAPSKAAEQDDHEDEEDGDEQDGDGHRDAAAAPDAELLLLARGGAIRRFPLDSITEVRPRSGVAASRLALAVRAVSPRAAQSQRMLRVIADARGAVKLGYVTETPLWRTSYRVVLDPDRRRGTLEGWVLLHNDTDEDWRGVRVELVNGRPDSFLFPFAAPRYGRRGLLTPESALSTVPQLLDRTPDALWGDHADLEALGSVSGTGSGFGSGFGRLGGSHRTSAPTVRAGMGSGTSSVEASDVLALGDLATVAAATGAEAGALFVYALPRPLDLRAHGSALVPFLQRSITARRVTLVGGEGEAPRMGLMVRNDTGQTLPAGPIAVYADGGFAGESALDRLQPGERRWLGFGADLDVEVESSTLEAGEEAREVTFEDERLREHFVRRERREIAVTNRGGQPRSVECALDVVHNSRIEGADAVERDPETRTTYVVLEVPARERVRRALTVQQGLARVTSAEGLGAEPLARLAASPALPAAKRAVLAAAAGPQREFERARREQAGTRAAITEAEGDLERLRAHLAALGGGGGAAAAPLVQRILDTEDRLARLRLEVPAREAEVARRRGALVAALVPLGEHATVAEE